MMLLIQYMTRSTSKVTAAWPGIYDLREGHRPGRMLVSVLQLSEMILSLDLSNP